MKFIRVLIPLLLLMVIFLQPIAAQDTPVYIVIVDDFNGNMRRLVDRVTRLTEYRNILLPLALEADRTGAREVGTFHIPTTQDGAERGSAAQGVPTPQPPLGEITIPNLRSEVSRAATGINRVLRSERLVEGVADFNAENCAVTTEGESIFSTGGASIFSTGGASIFSTGGAGFTTQPHGVRVEALVNELITQYAPDAQIVVRRIDTAGFATSVILDRLEQELASISSTSPGADIVVNMSFAVVPCTSIGTLAAYDAMMRQLDPTVAGDMAALQAFFDEIVASGVLSAPPNAGDAMNGFLTENCNAAERRCNYPSLGDVIPVAASGNAGAAYPYFPAAWSSVVAVSASTDDADPFVASSGLAPYSNAGTVMMPGTWVTGTTIEIGTSFAAPRYSFLMALHLLGRDNDFCHTGSPVTPSLPGQWGINPPSAPASPNDTIC